jgi:hypothetical protein
MTERVSILFHTIEKNICVGEKQHQVHHNSWDVTSYCKSYKIWQKKSFVKNGTVVSRYYFDEPASCLWANVTLADFGYPVYALWLYIFQKLLQEIKYGTEAFPSWIKTIDDRKGFNFVSHDRKEHLCGRKTTPGAYEGCDKNAQCALNLIFTFIFITV